MKSDIVSKGGEITSYNKWKMIKENDFLLIDLLY